MIRTGAAALIPIALTGARGLFAEATGKWAGGKTVTLIFTFHQDGAKVTGEVEVTPAGAKPILLTISDGRIHGDRISFTVSLGEDLKFQCSGTISGDEIQLNAKAEGPGFSGDSSTVLKRVK